MARLLRSRGLHFCANRALSRSISRTVLPIILGDACTDLNRGKSGDLGESFILGSPTGRRAGVVQSLPPASRKRGRKTEGLKIGTHLSPASRLRQQREQQEAGNRFAALCW